MRYVLAVMASRIVRRHVARGLCHSLALLVAVGDEDTERLPFIFQQQRSRRSLHRFLLSRSQPNPSGLLSRARPHPRVHFLPSPSLRSSRLCQATPESMLPLPLLLVQPLAQAAMWPCARRFGRHATLDDRPPGYEWAWCDSEGASVRSARRDA